MKNRMIKNLLAAVLTAAMVFGLIPCAHPQPVSASTTDNMKEWVETNVTSSFNDRFPQTDTIEFFQVNNNLLYNKDDEYNDGNHYDRPYVFGKAYKIFFRDSGVAVVSMTFDKEESSTSYTYFGLYTDPKLVNAIGELENPGNLYQGKLPSWRDPNEYYAYAVEKGNYYMGAKTEQKSPNEGKRIGLTASVRFYKAADGTFKSQTAFLGINKPKQTNYFKFVAPGSGSYKFTVENFQGCIGSTHAYLTMTNSNKKAISQDIWVRTASDTSDNNNWNSAVFSGIEKGKTYYLKVQNDDTSDKVATAIKISYKYTTTKHTVAYNTNGGNKLKTSSKTVTSGNKMGSMPTPTRSGYKFLGWYTKKTGGTKVTSSTKVTKDMSLYAHWTKAYTVKFNANGGKKLSFSTLMVATGKAAGTLPKAGKKNYALKGWYTKKKGGTKVTSNTKIKKNQTVYAQWTKVTVKKASKPTVKSAVSRKISVKISKVTGAKGYQIAYSTSSKFKSAKTVSITGRSKTISKLTKGKTYYVKVRAYKKDSLGYKVYGSYSKVAKIKVK